MLKNIVHISLWLLLAHLGVSANPSQFIFTHYTEDEGLCDNYLHDITQDKDGFVWIATHFGISRFDGLNFKNYHIDKHPGMLRDDFYHAFYAINGTVAFASSNGTLVLYDKEKDSFIDYTSSIGDAFYGNITGLYRSEAGECYLSTSHGIFKQNSQTRNFDKLSYAAEPCYKTFVDTKKRLWKCTDHGISLYDETGGKLEGFSALADLKGINNICKISEREMLLSSVSGLLYQVSYNNTFDKISVTPVSTPFKVVSELVAASDGSLWVGSGGNGLWRAVKGKEGYTFSQILPGNADKEMLKKISALYEDRFGNIWVGTQNTGLWLCKPLEKTSLFHSVKVNLKNIYCSSFSECENGDLWIGSDGQGLFLTDKNFVLKRHFSSNDELTSNNVLSNAKIGNKTFFASWGGEIVSTEANSQNFKVEPFSGIEKPLLTIKDVISVGSEELLACTSGDGAYFREKSGKWRRLDLTINGTPDRWLLAALNDKDGKFWIFSSRTIWHGSPDSLRNIVPDLDQNPSHNPLVFHQGATDKQGNLWVASNIGVLKVTPGSDSAYTLADFMPKGVYNAILTDEMGKIWTCGSNGIIFFDPETQKKEIVYNEKEGQGFFVDKAICQRKNGQILFGCKDGFLAFNPNVSVQNEFFFAELAELRINNEQIEPGSELLSQALGKTKKLTLPHNKSKLEVSFDMINFSDHNNLKTEYRLCGLDSAWTRLLQERTISFNHIPTGEYKLEVRFLRDNNTQVERELSLDIEILPAWWETAAFKTGVFVLTVIIFLMILHVRTKRIEAQKKELKLLVDAQTKELNEANFTLQEQKKKIEMQNTSLLNALKDKNQLISIIAHDLKNPMFAIVCGLEQILKNGMSNNETTNNIYHSATTLQNEMLQLLDWASEGQYEIAVTPKNIDAQKLIKDIIGLLNGLMREKKIKANLNCNVSHHVLADDKILSTIMRNIITNAIKFSPANGTIEIDITEANGFITIKTSDSGAGMSRDKVESIMNGTAKSTLGTNNEKGYGLGFKIIKDYVEKSDGKLIVESKPGEGTSVSVVLKSSDVKVENRLKSVLSDGNRNIVIDKKLLEGKSILVIDDDPLILLHLKTLLDQYVQVFTASNGEEGVNVAKKQIPDLVISDIDMPGMNGFEMYQKLKENLHTADIPLIFLSAKSDVESRFSALSNGAIDFINKPFDDTELIAKICNIIICLKKIQTQFLINKLNNEEPGDEEANAPNPLLQQLMTVIEENYVVASFSFEDIAKALGLSKSTLTRRLKTLTDKTPVEILSEFRLNKAKNMLEKSEESVSEVAYKVGFNDPLYFSKKFKEAFGVSPSKFSEK